jgi:signal transduction histidine kinase
VAIQREGSASSKPYFLYGPSERVATDLRELLVRDPVWNALRSGGIANFSVLRRQQSGSLGRLMGANAKEDADVALLRIRSGNSFGALVFPVEQDGWGRHRREELISAQTRAFIEQLAVLLGQAAEQDYVAAQSQGALQALSLVGHEMSEPLATTVSLTGYALMLARTKAGEANDPDTQRKIMNLRSKINTQTEALDAAMRLSLLVGRQIEGTLRGVRREAIIGGVIGSAISEVKTEISRGSLPSPGALKVPRPEGRRDVSLAIDVPLVRSALINVLRNAVKYSRSLDGEVRVAIRVVLRERASRKVLDIEVTNWGNMIPLTDRELIFDAFTRGENHNSNRRGMGLGLFLLRQIALAHGGDAFVKGQDALPNTMGLYRTTITFRVRTDLAAGEYPREEEDES